MTMPYALRSPRRTSSLLWAVAGAALLTGCSSTGRVDFHCISPSSQINGGLLLTVDVIRATPDEARRIQEMGEKWFYAQDRFNMRDKVQTVTFPAAENSTQCDRLVEITRPKQKSERTLVVIADYKYQNPDTTKHIMVVPDKKWMGQTIRVSVEERELRATLNW